MAKDAMQITKQVQAEFDRIAAKAAGQQPGVLEVVRLYGDYQAALADAEAYLSATGATTPVYTATNSAQPVD